MISSEDHPYGEHMLAAWVRQPELWSLTVTGLGLLSLAASLVVPISFVAIVLATIGAVSIVSGSLTLGLVLLGRLFGLGERPGAASDRAESKTDETFVEIADDPVTAPMDAGVR